MNNYKIYHGVQIGPGAQIGDYVVIGLPPRGKKSGELPTVIGANAVIRSHSVIYAGNTIGENFQTGHAVMVRESNEIGDNVSIGSHSVIEHHVKLGDGVRIHSQAFIPECSTVEAGAWIGPNVVFTNARYPRSRQVKEELVGPTVKRGAKIGANSTLLPGVTIGSNALVGAGSVVVRDVATGAVVAGNPARVINRVREIEAYQVTEPTYGESDATDSFG
jgi:acetyltransferase-like isoleucine patch superfamily enzyme